MSPEKDRTRDTVDSEPKHYQLSYSGPPLQFVNDISVVVGHHPCVMIIIITLFCFLYNL